jgi:tetratricopeptide (TPR) repeat protein
VARLFKAGRLGEAETACRLLLQHDPTNIAALLMSAELALIREDGDRAARICRDALTLDAGHALAHLSLGRALHLAGHPEEALASYRRAIELRGDLFLAHLNSALILLEKEEFQPAIAAARRVVELAPAFAEGHHILGRALNARQRTQGAEDALRMAVRLDPQSLSMAETLGRFLQQTGRSQEATEFYRHRLDQNPEALGIVHGLGQSLRSLGRFEEAAACFEQVIALAPEFGNAPRDLAMCRKAIDGDAQRAALEGLLDTPDLPRVERIATLYALGKWFDDVGHYDRAFARYAEANAAEREDALAAGIRFSPTAFRREIETKIRVFTPAYFEQRIDTGLETELPVFIVGLYRSGTTLTEQILASHPAIHGAGEVPLMRHLASTLMPTPEHAHQWQREALTDAAERYLENLQARDGAALRIVDKHPDNIFLLGLIACLFPQAKVIICRREARDNVLSCYFQRFQRTMAFTTDLADCAHRYVETERLADHWRRVLPLQILDIQYEKLVEDLDGQARRLIDFVGLPWDPACAKFHETERTVNTFSAWQVRQPIYQTSVGRWMNYEKYLLDLENILI